MSLGVSIMEDQLGRKRIGKRRNRFHTGKIIWKTRLPDRVVDSPRLLLKRMDLKDARCDGGSNRGYARMVTYSR